jgi:uncharacterized membrane protein YobD (UPF0266 family)
MHNKCKIILERAYFGVIGLVAIQNEAPSSHSILIFLIVLLLLVYIYIYSVVCGRVQVVYQENGFFVQNLGYF